MEKDSNNSKYVRYHIDTHSALDVEKWPSRFNVKVGKIGLARLLLSEIKHHGLKRMEVVTSRPCLYGVFSGPIGGFAPRPQHCVACLRCTTEYPGFVTVSHNPKRHALGDSYFTSNYIDAISYEAEAGMIPVKGAGYRGRFGGEGWDSMWTDMSEIVRPTRDGIHGREFISTVVDIGYTPNLLQFDQDGQPVGPVPHTIPIPLPLLIDIMPTQVANEKLWRISAQAAEAIGSLAIIPIGAVLQFNLENDHIVPLARAGESAAFEVLDKAPLMIEMDGWDEEFYRYLHTKFPQAIIALRTEFLDNESLLYYVRQGVYVFHLLANYHGRGRGGKFMLDLIREVHQTLVQAGIRQEACLIGSGGIIAAEHIPKAILCGLDAVALDTPLLVAMQGKLEGECVDCQTSCFRFPNNLSVGWGVQRIKNLIASWRDQLLEISGAMGLREIRRMRGEMGRAMFVFDLEQEAFAGVDGYELRK